MTAGRTLIAAVRDGLAEAADPARAPSMRAYMKSAMPYYAVASPRVAALTRAVFAAHPLPDEAAWRDTVLALFREATHREEWYAAVALAKRAAYRRYARRQESLPLYEALIVEAAWWDVVDDVAANLLGGLYADHATWMAGRMREWAMDSVMWKRRAAILSQLKRREDTDLALLYDCIAPNRSDREFFIRKAIGWALRQVAWRDPDEVVRYVTEHHDSLSRLSKREALKNVLKSGRITAIP